MGQRRSGETDARRKLVMMIAPVREPGADWSFWRINTGSHIGLCSNSEPFPLFFYFDFKLSAAASCRVPNCTVISQSLVNAYRRREKEKTERE